MRSWVQSSLRHFPLVSGKIGAETLTTIHGRIAVVLSRIAAASLAVLSCIAVAVPSSIAEAVWPSQSRLVLPTRIPHSGERNELCCLSFVCCLFVCLLAHSGANQVQLCMHLVNPCF